MRRAVYEMNAITVLCYTVPYNVVIICVRAIKADAIISVSRYFVLGNEVIGWANLDTTVIVCYGVSINRVTVRVGLKENAIKIAFNKVSRDVVAAWR